MTGYVTEYVTGYVSVYVTATCFCHCADVISLLTLAFSDCREESSFSSLLINSEGG